MASFSDTFDGYADGSLIAVSAGAWETAGAFQSPQVVAGDVDGPTTLSTITQVAWAADCDSDNNAAEAVGSIGTTGYNEISVLARGTGDTFYRVDFNDGGSGQLTLYRCVAGSFTQLDSVTGLGIAGTHTIRIECDGDQIRGLFDGVEQVAATDATITTGRRVGLGVYQTSGSGSTVIASWSGGDLGGGGETKSTSGVLSLDVSAAGAVSKAVGVAGALSLDVAASDDAVKHASADGGATIGMAADGSTVKGGAVAGAVGLDMDVEGAVSMVPSESTAGSASLGLTADGASTKRASTSGVLALDLDVSGEAFNPDDHTVAPSSRTATVPDEIRVARVPRVVRSVHVVSEDRTVKA